MIQRFSFILVFLLILVKLDGQQNNPFEIFNRIDSSSNTAISKVNANENPFEVDFKKTLPAKKSRQTRSKQSLTANKNSSGDYNLPLIIGVLSLVLIVFALNMAKSSMAYLYSGLINQNQFRIFQREQKNGQSPFSYLLYFIFILNVAVLICFASELLLNRSIWNYFLILLAALFGMYLIKHLLLRMSASIFPFNKELITYDFIVSHSNMAASLVLVIANILIAFTSQSKLIIWIALGTLALFLLTRYMKGIIQGLKYKHVSIFHFFMYICAFELLPNLCLCVYASKLIS